MPAAAACKKVTTEPPQPSRRRAPQAAASPAAAAAASRSGVRLRAQCANAVRKLASSPLLAAHETTLRC